MAAAGVIGWGRNMRLLCPSKKPFLRQFVFLYPVANSLRQVVRKEGCYGILAVHQVLSAYISFTQVSLLLNFFVVKKLSSYRFARPAGQ
jgi:hypothetical protein